MCMCFHGFFHGFFLDNIYQFTWFAKPVALSPLHCAQYGWENTEVDILQCVSCKACLDATISTSWDPDMCMYTNLSAVQV